MKRLKVFKAVSMVMSLIIVFSIYSSSSIQAQAAKSGEMYVIDSIVTKSEGYSSKYKLSYNKNGLVSKQVINTSIMFDGSTHKSSYVYDYKYKGALMKSYNWNIDESGNKRKCTVKFSYNSNKTISKIVCKGDYGDNYTKQYTYDKKKRIKKLTTKYPDLNNTIVNTYKYNKKNQVTKETNKTSGIYSSEEISSYKYDKKGNIINSKSTLKQDGDTMNFEKKYKITYNKKGQIAKLVLTQDESKTTITYKYKKIKINSKYKKEIENQQNKDFKVIE